MEVKINFNKMFWVGLYSFITTQLIAKIFNNCNFNSSIDIILITILHFLSLLSFLFILISIIGYILGVLKNYFFS